MAKSRRNIKRKVKTKDIKESLNIVISCEDSRGGLKYIMNLIRNYGFFPQYSCNHYTDLNNLVEEVKNEKGIKIVFVDVDDKLSSQGNKNNVNNGIQKAKSNNICIIVSNECLELWFLLHFKNQTAYIKREDIFKNLIKELLNKKKNVLTKNEVKNLENKKIKSIDWFNILDDNEREKAFNRCKKLIKTKSPFNPWEENPITLMCCFIEFLEKLSKIHNSSKLKKEEKEQKIKNLIQNCYPMIGMEINV